MSHPRNHRARRPLSRIVLIGAAATLAACGGTDQAGTDSGATTTTVAVAGATATTAPATAVRVADSKLGPILVDSRGRTLYGFTRDTNGTSTCTGGCLNAWPPMIVEDGKLPAGLDPAVFSVVAGPEGQQQLKAGQWPLYFYAGDTAAGDTKGQGSGGVWYVVDGRGELVRTSATTTTAANPSAGY